MGWAAPGLFLLSAARSCPRYHWDGCPETSLLVGVLMSQDTGIFGGAVHTCGVGSAPFLGVFLGNLKTSLNVLPVAWILWVLVSLGMWLEPSSIIHAPTELGFSMSETGLHGR